MASKSIVSTAVRGVRFLIGRYFWDCRFGCELVEFCVS